MKGLPAILVLWGIAAAQTAGDAAKALARRAEVDEIRWSDPARGPAFRAGIVRAVPEGLEVQRGAVRRVLPYDQVGGVKFGLSAGERQLLAASGPEPVPALRVFWEARRLALHVPGSNAGEFGLALARALRAAGDCAGAQALADEIASRDNDERRRARAKAESETLAFVQAVEKGKPEEVEKRAWAVTEADGSPPGLMLLATAFLMRREFDALRQIESENPRWQEDDEVKPVRERHYHRALDLALYPSLFHPLQEAEAAEGLWLAAAVYRHTGEAAREAGALEDLLALYPGSGRAGEARPRLDVLRAAREDSRPKEDTKKPKEKPQEPEPKAAPPPPKRYNLFED